MAVLKKETIYTIDNIYALPDGERAELIEGKIYYMAPPSWKHQRISSYLHNEIYNYIKDNHGKCEVLAAPFAVFLNNDDINYVELDISVICEQSKLDDKGCHGAPDWIVDVEKRVITVYRFEKETMEEYTFGEDVPAGIYEGFSLKVE